MNGDAGEAETFSVKVGTNNETTGTDGSETVYYLYEDGDEGRYFMTSVIRFTVSGSNATIASQDLSEQFKSMGVGNVFFSPFIKQAGSQYIEPQNTLILTFNTTDGFTLPENKGFAWFKGTEATIEGYTSGFYFTDENPAASGGGGESTVTYPAWTELQGSHQFKGTLTWEPGYEDIPDNVSTGYPPITFYEDGTFQLDSDKSLSGFTGQDGYIYLKYDENTGVISFQNAKLSQKMDFFGGPSYTFGIANAEGDWNGPTQPTITWQATEDGHIIIPDFTIIDYYSGSPVVVARYTNCTVDGYEPPAPEPEIEYPAYSEIEGEHLFTGTLTWEPGYENIPEQLATISYPSIKFYDNGTFELTSDKSLKGFTGENPNNTIPLTYDEKTGTITFNWSLLSEPNNYSDIYYQFCLANEEGVVNNTRQAATTTWQVTEDGRIIIPDFTIVNFATNTIVARYTNCKVDMPAPALTIANAEAVADEDEATITMDVTLENLEAEEVSSWIVEVTEIIDGEEEESFPAAATYDEGVATIVLTGLTPGEHTYSIVLVAQDEQDLILATSNAEEVTVTIDEPIIPDPVLTISNAVSTEGTGFATVTFDVEVENIDIEEIDEFKALFTNTDTNSTIEPILVSVTVENGEGTAVIEGLEAGSYNFNLEVIAYYGDNEEDIITSNSIELTVTVKDIESGVDSINVDGNNARYFTIDGVEVANPVKGIYIKVEGEKTNKVIVR